MSPSHRSRAMRLRRRRRIRRKLRGSAERPRVAFFKSTRHIYVQIIDDDRGSTLTAVHSYGASHRRDAAPASGSRADVDACHKLGQKLGQQCQKLEITRVVFDRGGFPYHGRVRAFAEGAREAGLVF